MDVLSELKRIGVPAVGVEAPTYTLVNLDTTFYTTPVPIDRSFTLIGYDVDAHIEPTSYTWHWGDGTADNTDTPGRPYPATDVTHTYTHATHDEPGNALSVDVTYAARYRIDGGDWQDIPDTITIQGPATPLPIKEASGVLVAPD